MTPEDRFNVLAESFASTPHVTLPGEGRGFGSAALRTHEKIFAMLVRGALVVKLPRQRVDGLVGAAEGTPFDANKGRPMKEWLRLDPQSQLDWVSLASEALDHVTPREQSGGQHGFQASTDLNRHPLPKQYFPPCSFKTGRRRPLTGIGRLECNRNRRSHHIRWKGARRDPRESAHL